ncbi:BREX-3 system phosphatase PglZ [Exiguobacterium sp. s21]|uniref:BREX-3 system phosphatase PglZ n=1 Tax=Exiguobacterium sp. s21 TaxID=2751244 RepID=UPI001BE97641|nr:BREX-3 system phosphatase PglZ [Exiguobacterium sp. s21]
MMNDLHRIQSFLLQSNPYYVVRDMNQLFNSPSFRNVVTNLGYTIHVADDPIAIRLAYETFRLSNQKGTFLLVISQDFSSVPFDILKSSLQVTITWGLLFPHLNESALQQFNSEELLQLLDAHAYMPKTMQSYEESMIYLFNKLYDIDLKRYFSHPYEFYAYVASCYESRGGFPAQFKTFLKEAHSLSPLWTSHQELFESQIKLRKLLNQQFMNDVTQYDMLQRENSSFYEVTFPGLSFYLRPEIMDQLTKLPVENKKRYPVEIQSLLVEQSKQTADMIPLVELPVSNYQSFTLNDWKTYGKQIGQTRASYLLNDLSLPVETVENIRTANSQFEDWLVSSFESLRSLPSVPSPKLSHQIPHFLSKSSADKIALIVMDGMSFTMWEVIKPTLLKKGWSFEEHSVFSWVPTLTNVSRQAIFSGKEPRAFADSFSTTNKEAQLWKSFWIEDGYQQNEIFYQRGLGIEEYTTESILSLRSPYARVYGCVIDVIDRFMHSAIQGLVSVFRETQLWLQGGYLLSLLQDLHQSGYEIYLTADHGHIEATGTGRINEGILANTKGQRVRNYDTMLIRERTHVEHSSSIEWNSSGLPPTIYPLLASGHSAFVTKNERVVTHGGIHIEEVIVPFVQLIRE